MMEIHNSDVVLFAIDPEALRGMRTQNGQTLDSELMRMASLIYTIKDNKIVNIKNVNASDWPLKNTGPVTITAERLRDLEFCERQLEALETHGVDNWQYYGDTITCAEGGPCELGCNEEDDEIE